MELTEKVHKSSISDRDPENPKLRHRSTAVAPAPMTEESPFHEEIEGKVKSTPNGLSPKSDSSTHDLHGTGVIETVTGGPNDNQAYDGSSENLSSPLDVRL